MGRAYADELRSDLTVRSVPRPAPVRLTRLRLTDFRAHAASEIHPAPAVNLVVGPNGAGKTNLLEAIGYLCLGKSILSSRDAHVARRGADHFEVEGDLEGDTRAEYQARLVTVPGEGKRAFINRVPLDRIVDLVGRTPVVTLSPGDYELTAGGPAERRRFLDATLGQASPVYLDDLVQYRRALRQRNALLQQVRRGRSLPPGTLAAWDEEVAVLGGRITARRHSFVELFAPFLETAFTKLGEPGEPLDLEYSPSVSFDDPGRAEDALRQALEKSRRRSQETGRTFYGPHLDEVIFRIGGHELRLYGSHGQHRTFALTTRIAQALYLTETTDERPILLLDDVFGPLDPERTRLIVALLASGTIGQSFVTAASEEPFLPLLEFQDLSHTLLHVERGTIRSSHTGPTYAQS